MYRRAALGTTVLLALLAIFQLTLALGLPVGQLAWGGRFTGTLPGPYRWASAGAVVLLALMAWVVLARAGVVPPGSRPLAIRALAWFFTAHLALNTLGNITSQSDLERAVMTPVSLLLFGGFTIVASRRRRPATLESGNRAG